MRSDPRWLPDVPARDDRYLVSGSPIDPAGQQRDYDRLLDLLGLDHNPDGHTGPWHWQVTVAPSRVPEVVAVLQQHIEPHLLLHKEHCVFNGTTRTRVSPPDHCTGELLVSFAFIYAPERITTAIAGLDQQTRRTVKALLNNYFPGTVDQLIATAAAINR